MKQVKRRFGPAAGVLVRATESRRSYRQMERFGRARIVQVLFSPLDCHAAEIIGCSAEGLQRGNLRRGERLTCFEKFRGDNYSFLILLVWIVF